MFKYLMLGDVRARKYSKTDARTRSILEKFAFDTSQPFVLFLPVSFFSIWPNVFTIYTDGSNYLLEEFFSLFFEKIRWSGCGTKAWKTKSKRQTCHVSQVSFVWWCSLVFLFIVTHPTSLFNSFAMQKPYKTKNGVLVCCRDLIFKLFFIFSFILILVLSSISSCDDLESQGRCIF